MTRRTFVGTVGLAAAGGLTARAAQPGAGAGASSEGRKLKLGLIGCGWYGLVDLRAAFKAGGVEVVGLCDCDSAQLATAAAEVEKLQGRRPPGFKHYKDLLAVDGLEAVVIATPPHWHALPFIVACERGLDIYCEKPLAYDIREGQAMAAAARKSGRIVQIGFQRRQAAAFRDARQYLQEGRAGRILQVDAQIHYNAGTLDPTPCPPPATLDWELWCGPGPLIPYSPQVGHKNWRLEKTSGHGHLVDWGIHLIDTTRWMLGLGAPRTVAATGGLYALKGRITTPDVLTAHFEFEQCPLTWRHRIWGAEDYTPETTNGIFFYGEKETVFATDQRWVVIPRGKGKERREMAVKSDAGTLLMADFLEAVRTRRAPAVSIDDAHLSTAAVKLAMIAYDTGAKIGWDAAKQEVVGPSEARALVRRAYRAPYTHPWNG